MNRFPALLSLLLAGCATPVLTPKDTAAPVALTAPIETTEELSQRLVFTGMTTADGQRSLAGAIEAYGICERSYNGLRDADRVRKP